jgi:beta-phosphoglucomutase
MIKAVIFDLDGVLAKTDSLHYLSWKKICDNHHFQFDKDLNNELRGISREECLRTILAYNKLKVSDEDFKKICDEESNNYNNLISNLTSNDLMSGAIDVLKSLVNRNIKLAIGTGSKHASRVIDKLEIRKYFDVIVDGNMTIKAKPDPECFLTCAKLLAIDPSEILVIEDADSGIMAANAGGFISVSTKSNKEDIIAQHYIDTLEEVLLLLK